MYSSMIPSVSSLLMLCLKRLLSGPVLSPETNPFPIELASGLSCVSLPSSSFLFGPVLSPETNPFPIELASGLSCVSLPSSSSSSCSIMIESSSPCAHTSSALTPFNPSLIEAGDSPTPILCESSFSTLILSFISSSSPSKIITDLA